MDFKGLLAVADPGEGNLDARALVAAILGPMRLAHGSRKTHVLPSNQPIQVVKNSKAAPCYVGVSLDPAVAGPLVVLVSGTPSSGMNSVPITLTNTHGPYSGVSYGAVVLPSEELYLQTAPNAAQMRIVATTVWMS